MQGETTMTSDDQTERTEIDLRGYQCPLPVLKTRNHLRKISDGDMIWIITDDPLATIDIPNFCNEHDQLLVDQMAGDGDSHKFLIKRQGKV